MSRLINLDSIESNPEYQQPMTEEDIESLMVGSPYPHTNRLAEVEFALARREYRLSRIPFANSKGIAESLETSRRRYLDRQASCMPVAAMAA